MLKCQFRANRSAVGSIRAVTDIVEIYLNEHVDNFGTACATVCRRGCECGVGVE